MRGHPSARSVASVLWMCASKTRRTGSARSGAAFVTSFHVAMEQSSRLHERVDHLEPRVEHLFRDSEIVAVLVYAPDGVGVIPGDDVTHGVGARRRNGVRFLLERHRPQTSQGSSSILLSDARSRTTLACTNQRPQNSKIPNVPGSARPVRHSCHASPAGRNGPGGRSSVSNSGRSAARCTSSSWASILTHRRSPACQYSVTQWSTYLPGSK